MHLKLVFLLSILGLWTVCEKYRKLMNELAQVVDLNNIDPAAAVGENVFLQAGDFLSLLLLDCEQHKNTISFLDVFL